MFEQGGVLGSDSALAVSSVVRFLEEALLTLVVGFVEGGMLDTVLFTDVTVLVVGMLDGRVLVLPLFDVLVPVC